MKRLLYGNFKTLSEMTRDVEGSRIAQMINRRARPHLHLGNRPSDYEQNECKSPLILFTILSDHLGHSHDDEIKH